MTETQINHRAPLARGEIRTHRVGVKVYQVMHVAGGSFTQATVRADGGFGLVLKTSVHEHEAVAAYADAIEQAESDRVDALDDADGAAYISSTTGRLIEPASTPPPSLRELVEAYGAAMARASMRLIATGGDAIAAMPYAERADEIKAEILARFGGER